jgi:hypothetical protein
MSNLAKNPRIEHHFHCRNSQCPKPGGFTTERGLRIHYGKSLHCGAHAAACKAFVRRNNIGRPDQLFEPSVSVFGAFLRELLTFLIPTFPSGASSFDGTTVSVAAGPTDGHETIDLIHIPPPEVYLRQHAPIQLLFGLKKKVVNMGVSTKL